MQSARASIKDRESTQETRSQAATAALRMRLWAFGGPDTRLHDLAWNQDKLVADLVQSAVREGQGTVIEGQQTTLLAHFADPLQALSTAKSLQLRLLTLHREPPAGQVVAAIIVEQCDSQTQPALEESNSAQILVSEAIYDLARNIPGFDFSSKPASDGTDGGTSAKIYELRWTDESTYGHLRKTSQPAAPDTAEQRRYSIQSELGRGCMGVVYKAYDQVIGRPVALKTIAVSRNFPNRDVLVERLKQEAKAAGSLDHPNIITIFDVGMEDDLVYLSMQLIEGNTLSALLVQGQLPGLPELLSYADQICSAVGYAHRKGVIHRDLKPANFMITGQGMVKILDFGIAKIEDATLTQSGMIVGTPTYMAPEQARAKKVDQRSDIFSLGSVFYELFTREKPFKGDITTILYNLIHEDPVPPSVINPALPGGIDAIIRKALEKDPAKRFQSCEEMREAFREQAALLENPAKAAAASRTQAPVKTSRPVTVEDLLAEAHPQRSRRWVWMGLAGCIVLAIGVTAAWAFGVKAKTGSFPPVVQKVLNAMRHKQSDSDGGPQQAAFQPPSDSSSTQAAPDASGSTAESSTTSSTGTPEPATNDVHPAITPSTEAASASGSAADNGKTQPSSDAAPDTTTSSGDQSTSTATNAQLNPFQPRQRTQKEKPASSPARDNGIKVEGFSRRDIPDLLNRADAAAGRGDYSLARYEYNIILRLDRQSPAARAGLRRVLAAEQDRAAH